MEEYFHWKLFFGVYIIILGTARFAPNRPGIYEAPSKARNNACLGHSDRSKWNQNSSGRTLYQFRTREIASLVKSGSISIQNIKEGENSCMKKTAYVGSFIDKRSFTISTETGWL